MFFMMAQKNQAIPAGTAGTNLLVFLALPAISVPAIRTVQEKGGMSRHCEIKISYNQDKTGMPKPGRVGEKKNTDKFMRNYNEIELSIISALNEFIKRAEDWEHDTYWTKSIKEILRDIGKKKNYKVYSSGINNVDYGEYLYDLVWSEYTESIISIPLVTEIEWRKDFVDDIQPDFEKLLIAKAELRLIIFQAENDVKAKSFFEFLNQIVDNFKLKQPGERYLYICLSHEGPKFIDYQKIV